MPVIGVFHDEPLSFPSTVPAPQSSIRSKEMTKESPNASLNGHFSKVYLAGHQALQTSRPLTIEQSSLVPGRLASLCLRAFTLRTCWYPAGQACLPLPYPPLPTHDAPDLAKGLCLGRFKPLSGSHLPPGPTRCSHSFLASGLKAHPVHSVMERWSAQWVAQPFPGQEGSLHPPLGS